MVTTKFHVLDTSAFIQPYRTYYAFDIAPSFWEYLIKLAEGGFIISIDKVYSEIKRGKDELFSWININFKNYFLPSGDEKTLESYKKLVNWVEESTQYKSIAKRKFEDAENADAWLLAYAMAHSCIIVTQEIYKRDIKREIPIPNVCYAFNIEYIDIFELLRKYNLKL